MFAEDGVYDVDGPLLMEGRAAVRAMVRGPRHQAMLPNCAHQIGPAVVELDGDRAVATGYSRVYHAPGRRLRHLPREPEPLGARAPGRAAGDRPPDDAAPRARGGARPLRRSRRAADARQRSPPGRHGRYPSQPASAYTRPGRSDAWTRPGGSTRRSGASSSCSTRRAGSSVVSSSAGSPTRAAGRTGPRRSPSRRRAAAAVGALDPRLETSLACEDDPLLTPLRVAWLPEEHEGVRQVGLSDLLVFGDPRDPGRVRQEWLLRRRPDRMSVIAGEAAPVSELRERWRRAGRERDDGARRVRRAPGGAGARAGGAARPRLALQGAALRARGDPRPARVPRRRRAPGARARAPRGRRAARGVASVSRRSRRPTART